MRALTPSQVLRTKLTLFAGSLVDANQRFFARADQGRLVPKLLVTAYEIMRAAVPMMVDARARAQELASADPVCPPLATYLERHIEEERSHDVWLLEDLERAGFSRADILAHGASPWTAALVGAQYYWIRHEHPLSLLSYQLVFEGRSLPAVTIDELQRCSGLPAVAFRTLREHSRIDPHHSRDLDALLDTLPLTSAHTNLLGRSLAHTLSACARILDELMLPGE